MKEEHQLWEITTGNIKFISVSGYCLPLRTTQLSSFPPNSYQLPLPFCIRPLSLCTANNGILKNVSLDMNELH